MSDMQDMLGMSTISEGIETNVDIVFVIDATRSMEPMIETVKNAALSFHEELYDALRENKRIIKNLRVRVIWFRDFYYDGKYAFGESDFFELPSEKEAFYDFISGIKAEGGGDEPESSLEALVLAMRSNFMQEGERRRHIIILFTDEEAHRFEDYEQLVADAKKEGCAPELYPSNMPEDLGELYNIWQNNPAESDEFGSGEEKIKIDPTGRRLIICAPDAYPWSDMELDLENVLRCDIKKGGSGEDLDMSIVYPMIAMSMAGS